MATVAAPVLLVTFGARESEKRIIADAIGTAARPVYLTELGDDGRVAALTMANVVLARNTAKELRQGEAAHLSGARLVQFLTAGIDHVRLSDLPDGVPVAANGGAYADAMAEHALAMTLAALKRLFVEQAELARGSFNQFTRNRMASGLVCGILGFGGIGVATARLMRAVGMRIHAINRRGDTSEPVHWIGTPSELDSLLTAADVLVVSTPLTKRTLGLIGARELGLMKPDAVLVNLARGEIVQEGPLYAHLRDNPRFTACIDAWWVEPVRHGTFRMDHPFMSLANVIGSPHNSASVAESGEQGLRHAIANIHRVLRAEAPLHLAGDEERML